uniref:Uncharacterized protein n=1 Tax=Leersia perrieri TaxID=77586 RepID=A0A0D9UZ04_9ORYZ
MAYAAFGAAVAYPGEAPAALAVAFVVGYGALLFLLPFSVYALEFLRHNISIVRTPLSVQACAAVTPVALSVAVLAVLNQARRSSDVAFATCTVWAANIRTGREYMEAINRMRNKPQLMPDDPDAVLLGLDLTQIRDASVLLAVGVSAAYAVAGGVAVGGMSCKGLRYAAAFFAVPMLCILYFQNTYAYPVVRGGAQTARRQRPRPPKRDSQSMCSLRGSRVRRVRGRRRLGGRRRVLDRSLLCRRLFRAPNVSPAL